MRFLAMGVSLGAAVVLAACGDAPPPTRPPMPTPRGPRRAGRKRPDHRRGACRRRPRAAQRAAPLVQGRWRDRDDGRRSGDRVKAGQTLAVLKRTEVDAVVAQANEGVEKARRDLERARQLRADEVATQEQVEDLTTAYNVGRSSLQAAQFNAQFARIEAPADGVVLQRLARASRARAGRPAGAGARGHRRRLDRARRARRSRRRAREPGRRGDGLVRRIPGTGIRRTRDAHRLERRPVTGTFEVEIDVVQAVRASRAASLPRSRSRCRRGESRRPDRRTGHCARRSKRPAGTVYVLDPAADVARRREVTVGTLVGDRVIVLSGLVRASR